MAVDDLLGFVKKASQGIVPEIEEDLGSGFVRLHISEAERRQARQDIQSVEQAVLEMLRNARDAGAGTVIVAMGKLAPNLRKITMIDDGAGIPEQFRQAVFKSRITSRLRTIKEDDYGIHGRGMALFSIKQRAEECSVVSGNPGSGTVFEVVFDLSRVAEKTDQSTEPAILRVRGRRKLGRGPHNVKRTVMQFALENPELRFYVGSASESMATVCAISERNAAQPPLFGDSGREETIWRSGSHLMTPKELIDFSAQSAGLELSLRNCQRITSRELGSLEAVVSEESDGRKEKVRKLAKLFETEKLAARISDADIKRIKEAVSAAASEVCDSYYLKVLDEASVRRSGSSLQVTIELGDSDEADGM